jgi:hypothetical protein
MSLVVAGLHESVFWTREISQETVLFCASGKEYLNEGAGDGKIEIKSIQL